LRLDGTEPSRADRAKAATVTGIVNDVMAS
jgi:hypothetical protein